MTPSNSPRVVLFDLDGVITRRDTFATLVARRLRSSPWRLAAAAPALPLLTLTSRWPERRGPVSRDLVRVALLGISVEQAGELAAAIGHEFADTTDWLNAPLIDSARRHLDEGDEVVFVTATEHGLARILLDAVGLPDAGLFGSHLARLRAGVGLRPHNYGRQKLRTMQEHGPAQPWSVLYTDSLADDPLARQVRRVVLVGARPALIRQARRRFGVPISTAP